MWSSSSVQVRGVALVAALVWSWSCIAHSEPGVAMPGIAIGLQDQPKRRAADSRPARARRVRVPVEWMPARGRECATSGRYKGFCQGPRRVPKPHGPAAQRAQALGLGALRTAGDLLSGGPKPAWIAAAGPDRREALRWPVDGGKLWRGLERAQRTATKWHPRHKGLDIGAPEGTLIHAVKSGIVAYSDNAVHGYGNLLMIVHPDGSVALYGHCRAIYVFAGQRVVRGQAVGEVGHTGIARGTHLHFEYRVHGRLKNPLEEFDGDRADTRSRRGHPKRP